MKRTERLLKTSRWAKYGNLDPDNLFVFTSSNTVRSLIRTAFLMSGEQPTNVWNEMVSKIKTVQKTRFIRYDSVQTRFIPYDSCPISTIFSWHIKIATKLKNLKSIFCWFGHSVRNATALSLFESSGELESDRIIPNHSESPWHE